MSKRTNKQKIYIIQPTQELTKFTSSP